MNTYNINDINFINSNLYKNFINKNQKVGFLKIRAYTASEAVPIIGLNVVVSKTIDNNKIIFYEGKTNESGVIEKITLPAPTLSLDDLNTPNGTTYDISATYDNIESNYLVNIYEGVYVVQTINVIPKMNRLDDNNVY